MIEREVKNEVRKIIKKFEQDGHVFWTYWPVQTGYGKHGIPDVLVCLKGRLIAIETKVDCKDPSTRQWGQLEAIEDADGFSLVIDQHNLSVVHEVFNAIVNEDESLIELAHRISHDNLQFYPAHI